MAKQRTSLLLVSERRSYVSYPAEGAEMVVPTQVPTSEHHVPRIISTLTTASIICVWFKSVGDDGGSTAEILWAESLMKKQ